MLGLSLHYEIPLSRQLKELAGNIQECKENYAFPDFIIFYWI